MSNIIVSNNQINTDLLISYVKFSGLSANIDIRIPSVLISSVNIQVEFYEPDEMGDPSLIDLSCTKLIKGMNVVAEIKDLQGLNLQGKIIDVTTLADTDFWRKFIAGVIDCTEVIASGFFTILDLKGQTALFNDFESRALDCYTIEFPERIGGTWLFFARVSNYGTGAMLNDAVQWMLSLRVTGETVLGVEASAGITEVNIVRSSDLGPLNDSSYFPPFNPDSKYYKVTFSNDSIKISLAAVNPHYVVWYIDDVYQGLFDFTAYTEAILFALYETKKISFKMWQDNRSPLYYDFMLSRTG